MDLQKIESDFKQAMLPEFKQTSIVIENGNIIFYVTIGDLYFKMADDIYNISQMKKTDYLSRKFETMKEDIKLKLEKVKDQWLKYMEECKQRHVTLRYSLYEYCLKKYNPDLEEIFN